MSNKIGVLGAMKNGDGRRRCRWGIQIPQLKTQRELARELGASEQATISHVIRPGGDYEGASPAPSVQL